MPGFSSLPSSAEARREPPPPRALGISLLALGAAGLAALLRPEAGRGEPFWGLVWILALVPPFLLSFYRGWRGAVTALGVGMIVLTGSEVLAGTLMGGPVDWWVYGLATVGLITVSLGAGLTSEALHQAGGDPERAQAREDRRREIERAIEEGELRLRYQPIVALDDGRVAGLEALVRWDHPRRGLMSPAEFIAFAESTDLILPLGGWVLERALADHGRWSERFGNGAGNPFFLSVNVSGRQVHDRGFRDRLRRVLRGADVAPGALQLEITESVLLEAGDAVQRLGRTGVRLAIDDFGKGYSSLSYLSRLDVDTLKVDRGFVEGMNDSPDDRAIVESVLELARTLEMTVVAEGVERPEQHQELVALGCDYAQGYHYAEPFPADTPAAEAPAGG